MKDLQTFILTNIPKEEGFYVYLLICEDQSLYCGWTTNLINRLQAHKNGTGAKYTRMHKPLGFYYIESLSNASDARKKEYAIKKLSRKEKIKLRSIE